MTCGIYKLSFTGYIKFYVGQSVNIEKRYLNHIYRLKNSKHNYKMQKAYTQYGIPELVVLLECGIDELNVAEKEAIEIFDCINNGLNISEETNIFQCGENNGYSKYSNDLVETVFKLLIDSSQYTYKTIARQTGMSDSSVRHIANGESHIWLKDKYPEEYEKLISLRGGPRKYSSIQSAKALGIVYPKVVHPITKEIFQIDNANKFARENNLDPSYFIKLLNGKALSCKGWKTLK